MRDADTSLRADRAELADQDPEVCGIDDVVVLEISASPGRAELRDQCTKLRRINDTIAVDVRLTRGQHGDCAKVQRWSRSPFRSPRRTPTGS